MRINNVLQHLQTDDSGSIVQSTQNQQTSAAGFGSHFNVDDSSDFGNGYGVLPSAFSASAQGFQAASANITSANTALANTGARGPTFRDGDEILRQFADSAFGNVLGPQARLEQAASMFNVQNAAPSIFEPHSVPRTLFSPQQIDEPRPQAFSGQALLEISRFLAENYIDADQAVNLLIQYGIQNLETVQVENGENGYNGDNGYNGENGENGYNGYNGVNGNNGDNGNGENGYNGDNGYNGANGNNGVNGYNGSNGNGNGVRNGNGNGRISVQTFNNNVVSSIAPPRTTPIRPMVMAPVTPVVPQTPEVESTPSVESVPAVESAPAVQSISAIEPPPVVESTPTIEQAPVVESSPAIESAPTIESDYAVGLALTPSYYPAENEPPPRSQYSYAPPAEEYTATEYIAANDPEQRVLNDMRSFFDFPNYNEGFMDELIERIANSGQYEQEDYGWLTNMWATVGGQI